MKLIDKSALVAEIERRKAINEKSYMQAFLNSNDNRDSFGYKVQENIEILSFIDTLEVKEVDVDKMCEFKRCVGFAYPENASDYQKHLFCYKQGIEDVLKAQKGEEV